MNELTVSDVVNVLDYNRETGKFIWKSNRMNKVKAGDIAGGVSVGGYVYIQINGKKYRAHRLAWLICYGSWPKLMIDHINGDTLDNRIANLRDISCMENQQNSIVPMRHKNGGLRGTSFHRTQKKWSASIRINGKTKHIGMYETAEDAHAAYLEVKRMHHPGFYEAARAAAGV